jgi:hypothetical protein
MRLELELRNGRLYTVAPFPAPRPGETVRVRLVGGARYSAAEKQRQITTARSTV